MVGHKLFQSFHRVVGLADCRCSGAGHIPFIAYFGLRHARPLSAQFSQLRIAADEVTDGHFGAQAELTPEAPPNLCSLRKILMP